MSIPTNVYGMSLGLLTDLYQITMAYSVWQSKLMDHEGVFHLVFRKNPFKGGYAVACGLEWAIDFLERWRLDEQDTSYLRQLSASSGERLFCDAFVDDLAKMPLQLDVDAIPEGTVVFPQEPLVRVRGPVAACMLVESALLNIINFQTLIATKAARIVSVVGDEPVLEFGLRRAQGIDGALAASRAAYVGGCAATSNVLAGRLFGIPVRGTHAHSWVMLFDTERQAFESYAHAMPHNCVFLVDTYDSLEGVRHAIEQGHWLREHGYDLLGIRLDSGDLAFLSIEARKMLDAAGFPDAKVYATNDLDEHVISSLKQQGAAIAVWGVGTRLVTAFDDPALGGVYKLSATRAPLGQWQHRIKMSEQTAKVSTPGILQVRRFRKDGNFVADGIFDEEHGWSSSDPRVVVDPLDPTRRKSIPSSATHDDLLVPVMRAGRPVYQCPDLAEVRQHALSQVRALHPGVKRFLNPHQFPVGLERSLHERRTQLMLEARKVSP